MNIIHLVLGKANPNRMNGVNKVADQLAKHQQALGYDVTLWGIANSLDKNYPERNYKTRLFQQSKNKLSLDSAIKTEIQNLSKDSIVHIHGSFIPEFYNICKLLDAYKVDYIYTPHGALTVGAMQKNNFLKKTYFKLFESRIIKKAKAVHLLGKNEVKDFQHLAQINHHCLVPNGQDLTAIPTIQQEGKNEHPVFGFCGRIAIFHKGLDLMLEGFQAYLKNGNKGTLELIGDGKDMETLKEKARKLGIEQYLVFHGAKFGDEKFKLINSFDAFLHTSRMEGFPTAVLEAAALQIPCITSEATNINSYIETYDAGLTLQQNTPLEIKQVMEQTAQLFYANNLQTKGANALKMVKEAFSWQEIAQRLIQIYAA